MYHKKKQILNMFTSKYYFLFLIDKKHFFLHNIYKELPKLRIQTLVINNIITMLRMLLICKLAFQK